MTISFLGRWQPPWREIVLVLELGSMRKCVGGFFLSAEGGFSRVPSMFSSLEVKVFYPT